MRYLKIELKKAFANKWLLGTLIVMSALAVICAIGTKDFFEQQYASLLAQSNFYDPDYSMTSMYSYLLFTRSDQPSTEAFYILLPLAAVLPYSWSLCDEKRISYLENVYTRIGRSKYLSAKSAASFSCSFVVVAVPLTLNLIVSACLIPAFETNIATVIYSGIVAERLWSSAYYCQPLLYCLQFILLTSCFSGAWGCIVQLAGAFVSRPDKLLASSYVLLCCIQAFEENVQGCITGSSIDYLSISPLDFIRGVSATGAQTNELSFLLWIPILVAAGLVLVFINRKRDEL